MAAFASVGSNVFILGERTLQQISPTDDYGNMPVNYVGKQVENEIASLPAKTKMRFNPELNQLWFVTGSQWVLVFDCNTIRKYEHILADNTIAETRDIGSFIWENSYDPVTQLNEYDLTLYIRDEGEGDDARYRRFTETHLQKAYSVEELFAKAAEALCRGGVRVLEVTLDHAEPGCAGRAGDDCGGSPEGFQRGDLTEKRTRAEVGQFLLLVRLVADEYADSARENLIESISFFPFAEDDGICRTGLDCHIRSTFQMIRIMKVSDVPAGNFTTWRNRTSSGNSAIQ